MLLPDYGMYVNAQQTLSLDLNRKVERGIRARREQVVADSRYVRAQGALQGAALVKSEEVGARDEQPPLETEGGSARATRSGKGFGADDDDDDVKHERWIEMRALRVSKRRVRVRR